MEYLRQMQDKLNSKKPALTHPEIVKLKKYGFSDNELFLDNIMDIDIMTSIEFRKGVKVQKLSMNNMLIKQYKSIAFASESTGIPSGSISAICKGNGCRKSAGGFKWKYA